MAEVVEQIDWSLLASKPSDQVSLERLFVLVMAVLCLENENDTAALYIGMIAECSEQYKSTLSQFLENKVFKLLDEKGEQHLSPHENKNFTSDMEWSAVKSTTSVPRDEVNQLVEEIKACNKTIGRLESELHEAVERLEIENERSRELQDQLEIRESEISRLTDELSHATEANVKLRHSFESDTRLAEVEAELTEARHLFAADQEILNKRLHAREVEIDALKKTIEEKEALVSTNEKLDRELKHATAELSALTKFKDNFERMEKEYIQFKNDYEIAKRSQESLQEELKKTKERSIELENENKQKERAFRDLTDKLKDYEIKISLKDSQIQDLEVRVARSAWQNTNEELGVQLEEAEEATQELGREKVQNQERDAQLEAMVQKLNSLTQTIETQKTSHSEQLKKLTEKIEELRKENSSMKKENESLHSKIHSIASQKAEAEVKKDKFDYHKDENSIMNDILQKSLELESSVLKYKMKSEELSHQIMRDREFYNLSLNILYSVALAEAPPGRSN